MGLELFISGGELRITKRVFIKQMFRPHSILKDLLNYNLEDQGKTRSLGVDKSSGDLVIISFNFVDRVSVSEDYHSMLEDLKKELGEHIKGSITLTVDGGYEYYRMTLDFNSDDRRLAQY